MTSFHKTIYVIFLGLVSGLYSETIAQNFSAEFFPINSTLTYKFSMNAKDTNFAYYYSGEMELIKGVGYVSNTLSRCSRSGFISKKVHLSSPDFPKPLPAADFVLLENTIIAFTILGNKDKDLTLYACEIDAKTFEQVNLPVPVFKYNTTSWPVFDGFLPITIISENKKCVMLASYVKDKTHATALHGALLNAQLEKIWDKTFVSDIDIRAMLLTQRRLTDSGQLMMTGFTGSLSGETGNIMNLSKSSFHVFTTEDQSLKISDHVLSLDTVYPLNVQASFLANGTLVCTGMYGKDNNIGSGGSQISRGVYYISYEMHAAVPVIKKATPFPAVFIQEAMDEPGLMSARPTKGLSNVKLKQSVVCDNGSIVILAEHEFLGSTASPHYYVQEIDAISFSPNGEVNWFKRIYKSQILEDVMRNLTSFSAFESDGKILVFFNDHEENSNDPSDLKPETFKGPKTGNLVCVLISDKDIMKKTVVIGFNKNTDAPQPLMMRQVGENSFDCIAVISKMGQTPSVLRINCQ